MRDIKRMLATAPNLLETEGSLKSFGLAAAEMTSYSAARTYAPRKCAREYFERFYSGRPIDEPTPKQSVAQMRRLQTRPVKAIKQYLKINNCKLRNDHSSSCSGLVHGSYKVPNIIVNPQRRLFDSLDSRFITTNRKIHWKLSRSKYFLNVLKETTYAFKQYSADFVNSQIVDFYSNPPLIDSNVVLNYDDFIDARLLFQRYVDFSNKTEGALGRIMELSDELFYETTYIQTERFRRLFSDISLKFREAKATIREVASNFELKNVLSELNFSLKQNVKSFARLIRIAKVNFEPIKRDLRQVFRSIITISFKVLNDFSGCDDEEITYGITSNPFAKSFQYFKDVRHQKNYYRYRFIYCINRL
jgi:hypothetical protein